MMKKVEFRWNSIDKCAYIIADFVHPGMHDKGIDLEKLTLLRLTNMVYDYYGKLLGDDEDLQEQLPKGRGQLARYMSCMNPFEGQLMLDFAQDPIGYWSLYTSVSNAAVLAKLAIKLLSIHINGAVVERVFSSCSIIHDTRRNKLKTSKVTKMVRVKSSFSSRECSRKVHMNPVSFSTPELAGEVNENEEEVQSSDGEDTFIDIVEDTFLDDEEFEVLEEGVILNPKPAQPTHVSGVSTFHKDNVYVWCTQTFWLE